MFIEIIADIFLPVAKVILDRSAHIVASPKCRFYRRLTMVLESTLIFDAIP